MPKGKKISRLFIVIFLLLGLGSNVSAEEVLQGKITEIKVTGNRLVTDEEIKDVILSFKGAQFSKQMVIEDLKRIFQLGYFEQKSIQVQPYKDPNGGVILEYIVVENQPITDLVVYGNYAINEINAYDFFADLVAKPENAQLLSKRIRELETEYLRNGFIVSRVSDIDIDPSGRLNIYIDEGIINEIKYIGNERTKEKYLNHLVKHTKAGQPYNESLFAKDYKKLQGTGYFMNVSRIVKPSQNKDGYTLEVQLKEKEKTTNLGLGGGVNSGTGLFGNANISKNNIDGEGKTLTVNALLGSGFGAGSTFNTNSNFVRRGRFTSLGVRYNVPYYRDSQYSYARFLNYSSGPNFTVDLTEQDLVSTGVSVARSYSENSLFRLGATASYISIEDEEQKQYVNNVTDNILELDGSTNRAKAKREARRIRKEQIVDGYYIGINPSYTYQNLDDPSKPRSGWKSRFGLNPNYGFDEVDSFTKLNGSITRFYKVGKSSGLVFNVRGGYELLGSIPQFSKYRLGANTGVRGYRQFSELGVGNKLLISTAEYRTPIYNVAPFLKKYKLLRNVDFALFADAGLIGGDVRLNRLTDRLSQAAAIGFGLRVNIPLIGALRVDVGFPLIDALIGDRLFRLNFGPSTF